VAWSESLKASTERVLTTHVGSLPRSQPVIGKMDAEIPYKKLAALVAGAALASHRLW
jgi:hypothetical protein